MQYYLAHSKNVVHLALACPEDIGEEDFRGLVGRMLEDARKAWVGQRALLFGLVSHGLFQTPARRKPHHLAHSILPRTRVRLFDDELLNLRIDDFRMTGASDPAEHVARMAQVLAERGPSPIATQALHRQLNRVHQRLHPRLSWLYPARLWGYSPYDLVLSMLKPVRPGRYDPLIAGARAFAGSSTGTTPACVFVPARGAITLNFYLPETLASRTPALIDTFVEFGLTAEHWHDHVPAADA